MKLGVAGLLPPDWRTIDAAVTSRVRAAGFHGAQWFFPRPLEADLTEVRRVKQAFAAVELEVAQVNGWYEDLVNPDDTRRAAGVQGASALVRLGRMVGSITTFIRPGSLNPRGSWYPHPGNHTPETFDRLVTSLRLVCQTAETEGVTLVIEGHVLSPLDSPRRMRDLLDAVASPALKINLDAVNFMGTVADVHDTRPVINQLFDLLGADIVDAHLKDVALLDALVVHIEEVLLGTGTLDFDLLLPRFQAVRPEGYVLIEHLPDDKVPQARTNLLAITGRLGLVLEI